MAKIDQITVGETTYELVPEIASLFDTTKAYNVGDCVIKDAVLYRFIAAHAAGAWVGTDAEVITVVNELTGLKADLNDLNTSDALKINKPETNPDGTNGQLLRTLGNGKTEWTDFAAPTDEQVKTSVDAWLDEHPEATTTVEDWSLTLNKIQKGAIGFVTPDMFGAVGDGETDDTEAIKAAVLYGINNACAVFIPQKTYILASKAIQFRLKENQSFVIYGYGSKSIIKRKNDSLNDKYSRLFDIEIDPSMTAPAKDVIFANFCIDSNRRGQSMATDGYEYDASADVTITNGTGTFDKTYQYIDNVIFEDMRFYDPVADHINISGGHNTNVKNVSIIGMFSTGRQAKRNDIGITGNPLGPVVIHKCNIGSIHTEYNALPEEEDITSYLISNSVIGEMSMTGKYNLQVDNCLITKLLSFISNLKTRICNSTFLLAKTDANQFIYNPNDYESDIIFESCRFVSYYYSGYDTNVISNCTRIWVRTGLTVLFKNCDFEYSGTLDYDADADETNDHIEGYPILCNVSASNPVIMDNCRISDKFMYAVVNYGNDLTIKNMTIQNYRGVYVRLMAGNNGRMRLRYDNVKFGDKCMSMMRITALNDTPLTIYGKVNVLPQNFNVIFDSKAIRERFTERIAGDFKRSVIIDAPLDYDLLKQIVPSDLGKEKYVMLAGDEFVLDRPTEQTPYKWICINNGVTETRTPSGSGTGQMKLYERFKTIGNGVGDTASRPICYLSKGFCYYDTDISKPIFWNGANWVDVMGTVV